MCLAFLVCLALNLLKDVYIVHIYVCTCIYVCTYIHNLPAAVISIGVSVTVILSVDDGLVRVKTSGNEFRSSVMKTDDSLKHIMVAIMSKL